MLAKDYRLKKRKDFERVFKNGKTKNGKLVFLKFLKNNLKDSRFGFIVGLKISKKSFIRNKIKRKLRAIIKENLSNLKSGLDVIIIARGEITDAKYQEIKEEVDNLLKKAKIL